MAKTPESVRDAVRAYVSRFDRVTVVLPVGIKETIRNQIGWNPGPYIIELVRRDFEEKNLPFDAESCPAKSEVVRGVSNTKPMYRAELEQISILLPPGTKDVIKTVLGQKCSPYVAALVEKDFREKGLSVSFSALRPKKAPSIFSADSNELPIKEVSILYLKGYSNKQIAIELNKNSESDQTWSADEIESMWRYADLQASDDPELNDLVEAIQIEKQRRRRFSKEHGFAVYSGNTEENPLDDKLFFTDNRKPFRKSTRGTNVSWTYNNRTDLHGLRVQDRLEIDNSVITKRVEAAWQELSADETVIRQWRDAVNGANPYKAYRSSQMISLMDAADKDPDEMLVNLLLMVDHIDINRDGTCTVAFLDGSTVQPTV